MVLRRERAHWQMRRLLYFGLYVLVTVRAYLVFGRSGIPVNMFLCSVIGVDYCACTSVFAAVLISGVLLVF